MNRSSSQALFRDALHSLPGGVSSPVRAFRAVGGEPFFAQRAQGARVWDVDGNEYIDYVCTWGPAILGHAHPRVVQAIQEAAPRGTSFGMPHALELALAQKIIEWVPSVEKVRFTSSGTEACMTAIRLARGFTQRDKILKFRGCYHGHADALLVKAGSGALTLGQPDSAGVPAAVAALTLTVEYNDLDAVRAVFAANPGEIAGVIFEPIAANAGLIPPKPEFLAGLRSITEKEGALLICDEVMTGFRLGRAGAQGLFGLTPDLSTFGKVIGGGLPVGAVGGRREIMDALAPVGPVYQAGTLSGNPLAMAAGLAQLAVLDEGGFERLETLGARLEQGVRAQIESRKLPAQWYRYGSMFCLYWTDRPIWNLTDAMTSDTSRFARFFHQVLDAGVYLAPSQFEAGFISTAHTEAEIDFTLNAFASACYA